jgi:hypothetical protein
VREFGGGVMLRVSFSDEKAHRLALVCRKLFVNMGRVQRSAIGRHRRRNC